MSSSRSTAIDQDELFETANRLEAEGREVTALTLLSALGRGSLTTIYKYLDAWRSAKPLKVASGNNDMPESVRAVFASAWRTAAGEAARETEAVKEKAAAEVSAAVGQFRGALEAIEKLEKDREADGEAMDELKRQVAELGAALQKAETDSAAHRAAAEQLRHQVKSQEVELERVHKEAEGARNRYQEELAQAAATAKATQEKSSEQIESLGKQQEDLKRGLEKVERERDAAVLKAEESVNRASKSDERAQAAEQEVVQARNEKETAIKEAAELKGRADTLKSQNDELLSRLTERKKG